MGSNIEYIGTTEAARLLQMTGRRVTGLCSEGKLSGETKMFWDRVSGVYDLFGKVYRKNWNAGRNSNKMEG